MLAMSSDFLLYGSCERIRESLSAESVEALRNRNCIDLQISVSGTPEAKRGFHRSGHAGPEMDVRFFSWRPCYYTLNRGPRPGGRR